MQRNVLLVALIALLAGCGGGGSDSTSGPNNGGGTGGNNADPLQQYINVNTQYTGLKTAASLDKVSLSRFMQALVTLQPEILPNYDDEQAHSEDLCAQGGQVTITPRNNNTELSLQFTNCAEGGGVFNGKATFRVVSRNGAGDVVEGLMIYEDTLLSHGSTEFVVRGSTRQKDISGNNCVITQNLSNLLLSVKGGGQQWFFENFYDQRFGTFGLSCLGEGMQLQGRLYLSDLGFVNVTTPELLKLPSMVYGLERQGRLALSGANNQVFSWQLKNSASAAQPLHTHHFSLNGANAFSYQYRATALNNQMMTDFRDTDGDGMSDAWEGTYGFNPQNPADATADADGDGFTNLQEFSYLGDPKDVATLPFIYQLSVSLNHTPGRQSQRVGVDTVMNHTFGADAYNVELHYKTEPPFQFSDLNYNCTLTGDRLEARCTVDYIQANTSYQHSVLLEASSSLLTEIQAPISVEIHTSGLNTSSQATASTMLFRQAAEFNFSLTQAYPGTGTLVGVVGEQSGIMLRLRQDGFADFVPGMTINVLMPAELGSNSAQCRHGADWVSCADVSLISSSESTEIDIRFTPDRSGIGSGIVQIMAPENSEPVAEWSFFVIAGQPASLLQQQIDASSADIIVVPADIYVGGLDLTSRKVILQGENQQTYLLGKINDDDYSLRQVRMDNGSEIRSFSLANLQITIGSAGAALTSNSMGIPELLQQGNEILAQGSLTVRKNRFSTVAFAHPFTMFGNFGSCSKLSLQQNDSATPYHFVYENNLMVNNGLQAGYCSGIYLGGGYHSRIEHNTISAIYEFITIQPANESKVSRLLARNNVFANVSTAVALNFSMENFDSPPDLQIDVLNNVFDQIDYPVRSGNVPYILADNILDSAGLNNAGIPLAGSAVIDAAANSEITDDVFDSPRPVDGNSDGQALSDIGAVERQN